MIKLYGLRYSPYFERARWAIEHHRVPHQHVPYVPMLGEPLLRLRTRTFSGPLTLPVLIDGKEVLRDSIDIARYAEARGGGAPLFPAGSEAEMGEWIATSNEMMDNGRALLFPRLLADRAVLLESLPPSFPKALRPLFIPLSRRGLQFVARKYNTAAFEPAEAEARVERGLTRLREALRGGKRYLLGQFSFADITMAVALQMVRPVNHRQMKLAPATRNAWVHPRFPAQFPEALEWRDALYASERGN